MKTTRFNTFETNSSSCHSITFSNQGSGFANRQYAENAIIITLKSNDFGWEEREYHDPQSNLNIGLLVLKTVRHLEFVKNLQLLQRKMYGLHILLIKTHFQNLHGMKHLKKFMLILWMF